MLTSKNIKEITFATAMGGYKKDEVDVFLDTIEADYERIEKALAQKDARIKELEDKVAECEQSKGSIQNVLISAQSLADKIVEEAKSKSSEIVAAAQRNVDAIADKGKKITTELDARALEKKSHLEQEIAEMIKKAEEKKAIIDQATAASVKRQQELFNALKIEMSSFRNEITEKYKEHLQLLAKLPSTADIDPEKAAKLVSENEEQKNDLSSKSEEMSKSERESAPEAEQTTETAKTEENE